MILPTISLAKIYNENEPEETRKEGLKKWLDTKRGLKDKFLKCQKIYFPVAHSGHWFLYVLCHPNKIANNYQASLTNDNKKTYLISMDSMNRKFDRPDDNWIVHMFCEMFNFFLSSDTEGTNEYVTPNNLPFVKVFNMARQQDSFHCGTHVTYWILVFERHFDMDDINNDTYEKDKNFAKTIGESSFFSYDVNHDMDQIRYEIREFIVRLAFIFSKSFDRKQVAEVESKQLNLYSDTCNEEFEENNNDITKFIKSITAMRPNKGRSSMQNCGATTPPTYIVHKSKTTVTNIRKGSKTRKATYQYQYGSDQFDYVVGKQWECKVHNMPCYIPYVGTDKLHERVLNAFKCDFILKVIPKGPENGFLAVWSALVGDSNYLESMKEICRLISSTGWNNLPTPSTLRNIASLQLSDDDIELISNTSPPSDFPSFEEEESDLPLKYETFRALYKHMVMFYIKSTSKRRLLHGCDMLAVRNYLSLPQDVIGTYGGYYCDEVFLSALEHVLQVRIFILRCTDPDSDTNSGRLHHVAQRSLHETQTDYIKKMLKPNMHDKHNTTFHPLRVVFLVRKAHSFDVLIPRHSENKALKPDEIPNLPLSLLGLQESDVQLKEKVRNHDQTIIKYNKELYQQHLTVTMSMSLQKLIEKGDTDWVTSKYHYSVLPSELGDYCLEKKDYVVGDVKFDINIDKRYLSIQCSKHVLASDYNFNFERKCNSFHNIFSQVRKNHLMHEMNKYMKTTYEFAPYHSLRQKLKHTKTDHESPNKRPEESTTNNPPSTNTTNQNDSSVVLPNFHPMSPSYYCWWKKNDHKICDDDFIFNKDMDNNCVAVYAREENCPWQWKNTINMCTFGAAMDAYEAGPYWKNHNNATRHVMPRVLYNSRQDTETTEQGFTLIHNTSFLKFASQMNELLFQFISKCKEVNKVDGTNMLSKYKMAKKKIPENLKIGDTCFTTFSIVGGENTCATLHNMTDDLFQIFFLHSQSLSGGDILITNDEGTLPQKILGHYGTVVCGDFSKLYQEHEEWTGMRYVLYFSTSKKIFDFFNTTDEQIWNCYKQHEYPLYTHRKAPVIQYNKFTKYPKLTWSTLAKNSRKKIAPREGSRGSGWCDIFLPKSDKHQSTSWLRNCLQDAVLNASIQLKMPINKKQLYTELPPKIDVDLDMFQLMNAECVKNTLTFERMTLDRLKGGIAYNLLQMIAQGVYLCLCEVKDFVNGEYRCEKHAFVYNSNYEHNDYPWCKGAIIDNRSKTPVRLIEHSDRKDKITCRNVFDSFFNAQTIIQHVYLVETKHLCT